MQDRYADNISRAQRYLEDKVSSGVASNYSLCLVAYALALANSPVAGTALTELSRRAHYRGNLVKALCCFMFRNVQQLHSYFNVLPSKMAHNCQ